ncbi:hypothetical protein [Indiicoccus explosivorum]|uniref:hypothetical protein n=1 Tax=Indiicoccus explosivorum TaxID=1917864 RepID=UPI000B44DBE1|nr:hypothetical protein [Indiicoccus explosivorum]
MNSSAPVASVTYTEIRREVGREEVEITRQERLLLLFEDKVSSPEIQFPLNDVWDVSAKRFSDESGLLYLHTNSGTFTYKIPGSPRQFIQAFRRLKGRV